MHTYLLKRSKIIQVQARVFSLASEHISFFNTMIGDANVLTDPHDIQKYTTDWTRQYIGGGVVLRPKSTDEISRLLRYCNEFRLPVVTQGGNTGLVGGQVGVGQQSLNEIILSMERLNKIISIDPVSAVVVAESGCIVESLMQAAEAKGFILPIDLGSKGSCTIGGNVATNAGGLRLLRYGSLHQNVLGMEVVLADGRVLDMLRLLHKDNCGYHSKNLFIGSFPITMKTSISSLFMIS